MPGFRVEDVLGRGAMGVVLRARDEKLDRPVALKMILAGGLASAEERARFQIEAQAVARLNHPNVVQVFEVGEHDGRPYLALEYAAGGTLAARLAGEPQPPREAARLAETLARAVHAAHEKGVVHRDLKPANVLFAADGTLKVSDFGLAKRLDVDDDRTRTGMVMGTPTYMAPEQAAGKVHAIGPASDVYSLGAMLYEMLTGRPPLKGASPLETLVLVRHQEPVAPGKLVPGTPADLETICLRCLEKEPGARYSSARDLADELARFLGGEPIHARPVGHAERLAKWARRNPVIAGLSAGLAFSLIGGGAFGIVQLVRATRAAEHARDEAVARARAEKEGRERVEEERKRAEEGERRANQRLAQSRAVAAQQRAAAGDDTAAAVLFAEAYAVDPDPRYRVGSAVAQARAAALEVVCTGPELPAAVALAAGAGRVAVASGDDVRVLALATGTLAWPAFHLHGAEGLALAPDGGRLAVLRHGDLVLLDAAGHRVEASGWGGDQRAWFSPDGRKLVVFGEDRMTHHEMPELSARVVDAATGERDAACIEPLSMPVEAVFSPDGRRLALLNLSGYVDLLDFEKHRRLDRWYVDDAAKVRGLAFTPDGAALVGAAEDRALHVWDARTGKPLGEPIAGESPLASLALSPDGTRAVVGGKDGVARVWDLAHRVPVGAPMRHENEVARVAYSPDGAFVATGSADRTVRVWSAATGEPAGPVLRLEGPVRVLAFERATGRLITGAESGPVKVWSIGAPRPVARFARVHAFFPDELGQDRIAIQTAQGTVELIDPGSGQRVGAPLEHGGRLSALKASPDRARLVTLGEDRAARVWRSADATPVCAITLPEDAKVAAFSEDGRRLAVGYGGHARVFDATSGAPLGASLDDEWNVDSLELRGNLLDVGTSEGRVSHRIARSKEVVWDLKTGRPVAAPGDALSTKGPAADDVRRTVRSADGHRQLVEYEDGRVALLDAGTHKPVGPPIPADPQFREWSFSDDSRWLIARYEAGFLRMWNAATGQPSSRTLRHGTANIRASFSPDGRWLATVGEDTSVRLWECGTGEPIDAFECGEPVISAGFRSRGARLVVESATHVLIWDVSYLGDAVPPARFLESCRRRTGHALNARDEIEPLSR